MRVGLSDRACRSRLQNTLSRIGKESVNCERVWVEFARVAFIILVASRHAYDDDRWISLERLHPTLRLNITIYFSRGIVDGIQLHVLTY